MAVPLADWLDLARREYLGRFVPGGGSAVKFVVAEAQTLLEANHQLEGLARRHGLRFVPIDAAKTRLHMIQDVFFAIARAVDWDRLAQRWVEALLEEERYEWPRPGQPVPLQEIADHNGSDVRLLRKDVNRWLTRKIIRHPDMAQDFRYAMAHLCLRQLEVSDDRAAPPILEWLRGELRSIGPVKPASVSAKITRHNGRAMLRSLCSWLRLSGEAGLLVVLDIRQLGRPGAAAGGDIRYSAAAVLDAFEVLRQLVDDIESLDGLFIAVTADDSFGRDDDLKRGVAAYTALKERIWADVHAKGHENPLAPLLTLTAASAGADRRPGAEMPFSEERVAVEALRAGVPNRAAIRRLGASDARLCERFVEQLRATRDGLASGKVVQGEIVAGGFGSGKSHLLGYLKELALHERFVVSQLPVSKETPLFDPERLFAAAIRNATVPDVNDDVMTAVLGRLKPDAADDLERWASEAQMAFFAALFFLHPRQALGPDDHTSIARFFSGGKLGVAKVRSWLKIAGAQKLFDLKPIKPAELSLQRLQIMPRLFAAAGFSGWCVLIDEVELIGRYSTLQRGRSYAEMCRWLALSPEVAVPGLLGLCAISDTFKDVMFSEKRLDGEKIPRALRARRMEETAALAEIAMAAIEQRQHFLPAPNDDILFHSLRKVHELYTGAYGCQVPIGDVGERLGSKSMRRYIKSWVTGWDLQRLYGVSDAITTEAIEPDYSENADLESGPADEALEEETS